MNGQYRVFPVFIVFAFIAGCVLFRNSHAESDPRQHDILDLEDGIIINGLKMNDSESIEPGSRGMVLYDDGFLPENQDVNHAAHSKSRELGFDDLFKSDTRWHITEYTVSRNDTIWDIARRFNTDYKLIINVNSIADPGALRAGARIKIPNTNGIYYTVKKGDTLHGISRRTGVSVKNIRQSNAIDDFIRVGMKLFIPDAAEPVRHAPEKTIAGPRQRVEKVRALFTWPASGRISSSFGNRLDPFSRTRKFHCGIDISLEPGTPVRAARDGRVIFSGWKEGYGNVVVIRHENGYVTVYAHNRNNLVTLNDTVSRRDIIALSGMTGAVTGAHLHFEIRKYLTPLNPVKMLK